MIHPISALVVFLHDRYDEKRQRAEACAKAYPPPWEIADRGSNARIFADPLPLRDYPGETFVPVVVELDQHNAPGGAWLSEHLDHIAHLDPATVLADLQSKRAIADRCARIALDTTSDPDAAELAEDTLRDLALPFHAHEDYREEWQPQ